MPENTSITLQNYSIEIGNAARLLNALISKGSYTSIFVLVDENTKKHCLPALGLNNFKGTIQIKSGEQFKTLESCQQIWDELFTLQADRKSLLINLGGGVIGDMGGFCASTFKRGFKFVQIPTTLLAQVDASIGGKLGIDYNGLKNAVGLFQNPVQVIIDPDFFISLPKSEILSGFAEVLKHALIDSETHWQNIKKVDLDNADWHQIVHQSLLVKKRIVEIDPYEENLRQSLNLGHTVGHAIEAFSLKNDQQPLLHGHGVALGILIENFIAKNLLGFPENQRIDIENFILKNYPYYPISQQNIDAIMHFMRNDKKNKQGKIKMSLLKHIGQAETNITVSENLILKAINQYQKLGN